MTPVRILFAVLAAALAIAAAGCGGGGSANVPSGAIAVVDGSEISRSDLDGWLGQAKRSYEATKQEFPKVGTSEYQQVQTYWVSWLVQYAEFEQAAKDLGIKITKKDIDKGSRDYVAQKFGGDRKKFERALKAQDFSMAMFRQTVRFLVLNTKIFEHVTKDVKVSEKEARDYYNQNLSTKYEQKASREVRHILVSKKKANGQVDYPKSLTLADQLDAQLKRGASFAAYAKKYSADTSSAAQGGKYTAFKGQTVPEFDQAVFTLRTGEISTPVKTTYGYHIIQALTKITPGKTTPFKDAEPGIEQTLLQQKKQTAMYDWVQKLNKKYKSKISYAAGFAPPDLPEQTTTATQ